MNTRWLLGVTGGIAAYKTPELVRLIKKQGAEVRVVMTQNAHAFVTPMTLQAVSQHAVYSALMDADFEAAMGHIELARWAQGILIAPLSAHRLASLALGLADDLLTTLCLASKAPIFVAPAMNKNMWDHPATQQHVETLHSRGVTFLGPESGEQACGDVGWGRMMEPESIVSALLSTSAPSLEGHSIVITAGPTREAIDPVRFISNRSSGKMGFALAQVAQRLGAKVTLISGPVALNTPLGVTRINVETAEQMYQAAMTHAPSSSIFISCAAVADYRPQEEALHKLKMKHESTIPLMLVQNPDIVASVAKANPNVFCVGFAAETHEGETFAKQKLHQKQLDLIALNDVSDPTIGFDSEANALSVFSANQSYALPKASKEHIALSLLTIIRENIDAKYRS